MLVGYIYDTVNTTLSLLQSSKEKLYRKMQRGMGTPSVDNDLNSVYYWDFGLSRVVWLLVGWARTRSREQILFFK